MIRYFLRAWKMLAIKMSFPLTTSFAKAKLRLNGVKLGANFKSRGIPLLDFSLKGVFIIGDHVKLNNAHYYNLIGRQQRCCFSIGNGGTLKIGNYVGMSCTTIVCKNRIEIKDHVHIGGNCEIYDTDFHDLRVEQRTSNPENFAEVKTRPVVIEKYVFIGAHSTILKGVTIGEGAIIGACSLVSKNIPPYEIWGGNPIQFLAVAPRSKEKTVTI